MSSAKHELRLMGAFATLAVLALAVGCRGFFQNPTLTSIAISPASPAVELGQTATLQAFGTYDDGSRNQIRSGVTWSSSDPTTASITSGGVLSGVSIGTVTITADAQGLSSTASATVVLNNVTAITVNPTAGAISKSGSETQNFTFTATANGTQQTITTDQGAVITITPTTSDITCSPSGDMEACTGDGNQTAGTYNVTMTYPGSSASATATLTSN